MLLRGGSIFNVALEVSDGFINEPKLEKKDS